MCLRQKFEAYTAVLRENAQYWRFSPFEKTTALWATSSGASQLNKILDDLSDEQVDSIDSCSELQREVFSGYFAQVFGLPSGVTETPPNAITTEKLKYVYPFWLTNGISGRKLSQITSLIACLPPLHGEVLEWCAGKGHLGRLLGYTQKTPVHSVEYNADLCQQGTELAHQHKVEQRFICADVLNTESSAANSIFSGQHHAVALHACGDLHCRLLQEAPRHSLLSLHIAPCCYHLINSPVYQPMSHVGRDNDLALSRDELKLAVQAQVTGGERVRRLRYTEILWRQMYQLVREYYLEEADYQSLPSVPKHWFSGSVQDFMQWAAAQHKVVLPVSIDWVMIEKAAKKRVAQIQRLELVRHVFRRPLEIWLILDRALYLEEQGYEVTIKEFCDYSVSPRNFLIQAYKQ